MIKWKKFDLSFLKKIKIFVIFCKFGVAVPVLPPRAAGRKGGAAASRWQADHLIDGRKAVHQICQNFFS
jgi:hypothetical protein